MNRLYRFFTFLIATLLVVSCNTDTGSFGAPYVDNYDHEAQLHKDLDSLRTYLKTHYFNTNDEAIWTIGSPGANALPSQSQIPLFESSNLDSITGILANDTATPYTMYYLKVGNEGSDPKNLGSPSILDSVFVNYTGYLLDSTVFDSREESPTWFDLTASFNPVSNSNLYNLNQAWAYGFQNFLGGSLVTSANGEFSFDNPGRGYIFYPSGLGYKNNANGLISENSPLIFKITLNLVEYRDHDLDNVPSRDEIDTVTNTFMLDTDGDGVYNYLDQDDDNDGILTKDEVEVVNGKTVYKDENNNNVFDHLE